MDTNIPPTGHHVNYRIRMDTNRGLPSFADWLRSQLRRREWSGADLARALDTPNGTVARWLRGERTPSPESCDRLGDVLHVDPDLVLTIAGHRPATEPIDADDPRARIIALVRRMSVDDEVRVKGLEEMIRVWVREDRDRKTTRGHLP